MTAMYIAVAAAQKAGILDDYIAFLKSCDKLRNFQTQVANYMNIPEGKDEIDINRGNLSKICSRAHTESVPLQIDLPTTYYAQLP